MDQVDRILHCIIDDPEAQAQIRLAFENMWTLCSDRYADLPLNELQTARERLAACLVLIACRNDDPTKFDAEWLTDEFVHRLCNTDCLLDTSSVMDFGEEAEC